MRHKQYPVVACLKPARWHPLRRRPGGLAGMIYMAARLPCCLGKAPHSAV